MRQRRNRAQSESQKCITDSCFGLISTCQYSIMPQRTESAVNASFLRSCISLAVSHFMFFFCWLIRSFIYPASASSILFVAPCSLFVFDAIKRWHHLHWVPPSFEWTSYSTEFLVLSKTLSTEVTSFGDLICPGCCNN